MSYSVVRTQCDECPRKKVLCAKFEVAAYAVWVCQACLERAVDDIVVYMDNEPKEAT